MTVMSRTRFRLIKGISVDLTAREAFQATWLLLRFAHWERSQNRLSDLSVPPVRARKRPATVSDRAHVGCLGGTMKRSGSTKASTVNLKRTVAVSAAVALAGLMA